MNIVISAPCGGGVAYHRAGAPGAYLGDRGHSVQILSSATHTREQASKAIREADVVHVVGMGMGFEDAPREFHERRGVLSVDLDDDVWAWFDDPAAELKATVTPAETLVTPERVAKIESWLAAADVVTTTTDYLANVIRRRGVGEKVRVCPNAIAPEMQRQRPRYARNDGVVWDDPRHDANPRERVIAWTGTVAHVPDLPPVIAACARVGSVDPTVTVRTLGPVDWGNAPGFAQTFRGTYTPVTGVDRATGQRSYQVPFEVYYDTLETMSPDVAVVALRDAPFTRGKSAITLYSWAVQGVACVVSDAGPYAIERQAGCPALYVSPHESVDAWTIALRELLYDPARAKQLGDDAREWVLANRSWPRAADAWERAWGEVMERKGVR